MPILFRVWGNFQKKLPNLEKTAKNLEKGLLKDSDVKKLVEISGLALIEKAFDKVGYSIETIAYENEDSTCVIVKKCGKKQPKISEELKNYTKANYILKQELGSQSSKDYELELCAVCSTLEEMRDILPRYIGGAY